MVSSSMFWQVLVHMGHFIAFNSEKLSADVDNIIDMGLLLNQSVMSNKCLTRPLVGGYSSMNFH